MKKSGIALLGVLVTLAAVLPVMAAGESIELPGGEILQVMYPGVDGVSVPRAVASTRVAPQYPEQARSLGVDSSVTVAVLVRRNGRVAAVEVVEADHPGLGFETAVRDAVREWRFEPARKRYRTVHSYTLLRLNFRVPDSQWASAASGDVRSRSRLGTVRSFLAAADLASFANVWTPSRLGGIGGTLGAGSSGGAGGGGSQGAVHGGGISAVEIPRHPPGTIYKRPDNAGQRVAPVPLPTAPVRPAGGS